jgi:hypothetical protein
VSDTYSAFLMRKAVKAPERGLREVPALAPHLFPFQRHTVDFALRVGSAGVFLDTGLGKTEVQLEWCRHAAAATNGRALILTPLAVAGQTRRRAERWGYEARVIREQTDAGPGINICNYDRLDHLDPSAFVWSNPGDVVLSPFMGIGSEGYVALKLARKFCGVELKESYWRQACRYLDQIEAQGTLSLVSERA